MDRSAIVCVALCFILASSTVLVAHDTSRDASPLGDSEALQSSTAYNGNNAVQGQAFLNFSAPIAASSSLSATWFAQATVSDDYGTDLLENQSFGLREQIDLYLGDSDGWVNSSEADDFAAMVASARNWTDAAVGGCCTFDYTPMNAPSGNEVSVMSPLTGPVNATNGTWGWSESADLTGVTDGRTMRVLDLPRVGALIEELPLSITLPENWEVQFSPMIEIFSGEPRNFTVNRSQAPVAYNIRITIGENFPPSISASRFPATSSSVALDSPSSFSAVCNDGPLESPVIEWFVSKDESLLATFQNPWFEFSPADHGFSHGDVASVVASCTDSHGMASHWYDNVVIDGVPPEWTGDLLVVTDSEQRVHDLSEYVIEVDAGSELVFDVNGSDELGLPVKLELFTNISEGWRQYGVQQKTFRFTANQGAGVNGAHLSIDERHQSRDPTMLSMLLQLSDDARNIAFQEWAIRVLDANPPTIMMDIAVDGILFEPDDEIHENDAILLVFSKSFDDLDAIDDLTWSVSLDGADLVTNGGWSSTETLELENTSLGLGDHEVIATATDSSGNTRTESYDLTVHPMRGAHLVVIEKSHSGGADIGSSVTFTVLIENQGSDPAFARVCLGGNCSRYEDFPGATLEGGSTPSTIEFEFVPVNESLEGLYVEWDSAIAGTNGVIPLEYSINRGTLASEGFQSGALVVVLLLTIAMLYAIGKSYTDS